MCTSLALPLPDGRQLFGRTLDLDTHFGEALTLTPRRYPFRFADGVQSTHHALLGMAAVTDGYPLYAEAMNERGLCMAGLRFAGNAVYADAPAAGKQNLAPWELIPYLLGRYATLNEVRNALRDIRVVNRPFAADLPTAPLHWHIADACASHGSLTLEITAAGMRVYDNPVGVLCNNPPFPYQLARYAEFSRLGNTPPKGSIELREQLAGLIGADVTSLGEGALGLPGDYSSPSRFIRAACLRRWVTAWSLCEEGTGRASSSPVTRFFRILAAVAPMAGAVLTERGDSHRTLYTVCMDGAAGVCHYHTEAQPEVRSVAFSEPASDGDTVRILQS